MFNRFQFAPALTRVAIGLAHTGRSWGAAAQQRQEAAASAPLARVARRDENRIP